MVLHEIIATQLKSPSLVFIIIYYLIDTMISQLTVVPQSLGFSSFLFKHPEYCLIFIIL